MKFYTVAQVAEMEGLSVMIVGKYARLHKLQRISDFKNSPYIFTEEDYLNFKNRPKKAGNPNFGKDFHKNRKKDEN